MEGFIDLGFKPVSGTSELGGFKIIPLTCNAGNTTDK